MTTQEIWQLQALEAPRVSAAYMRLRSLDLARRTQIRNGLNCVIGAPCVLFVTWCSWRYLQHRPIMVVGLALCVLASVYLTFRWHRVTSASKAPDDAGVLDSLTFYRRQLERQRAARRNWRRRLPVVPGLITVLASLVLELNPIPWARVAMGVIWFAGIFSVAMAVEERTARRLQREIDALDSLVVGNPAR